MKPMREVCFLIARGGAIVWSDSGEDALALPDSRARWEAIWSRRAELEEISHSHPAGPLGFSAEDDSTVRALDAALGRKLRFSVVAPEGMVARDGDAEEKVTAEPWWANVLRLASGMKPR